MRLGYKSGQNANNHGMENVSQDRLELKLLQAELKKRAFDGECGELAKLDEDACDSQHAERAPKDSGTAKQGACAAADPEQPRQIVVVCFGTMAIAGDSLGPMAGSILKKMRLPAFVYGTEENTVNGKNMKEWLAFITSVHKGALFIAVDASLGGKDRVGELIVRDDGVCPAAIKGKRARFGDIGVLAVVAENKSDALMQLMSVSPLYVAKLADKVADLLYRAIV